MIKRFALFALTLALVCLGSAQTVSPILQPHQTYVDGSGLPCAGCKLYTYQAGTTTPLATYTDVSGVTPNPNPIILDVTGSGNIWLSAVSYKFQLRDALGNTLWTVDQVSGLTAPLIPTVTGTQFGSSSKRWDLFVRNLDISGTITGNLQVSGSITAKAFGGEKNAAQYASIQAAIDDLSGSSGSVYVPCGTYVGNITISNNGQRIRGQAQGCVHIQPAVLSSPAILYASTSSGGNGLNYDGLEEVSIECPSGQTCTSDGIRFTGTDPNDRHTFRNVSITGLGGFNTGFQNGINIVGRMIWTTFDHVEVRYSRGDGLHSITSAVVNHIDFRSSQFNLSQNYGINFQNSNWN